MIHLHVHIVGKEEQTEDPIATGVDKTKEKHEDPESVLAYSEMGKHATENTLAIITSVASQ